MNQKLQDLYKRLERAEIIIMHHEKDMVAWEIEKQKIKNLIEQEERA
jgi:hypothetical protein